MASRKAKPRVKKPPRQPARPAEPEAEAAESDDAPLPMSARTREIDISALGDLVAAAATHAGAAPPPPTTRVLEDFEHPGFDDLAQTTEAPSASRLLLLDAGEAVFSELGFAATTDEEIARAAGVSLDVLHAHFSSKTALLHALADRFASQAMTVTEEATRSGIWDKSSPREVVEVAVRSLLDAVLGRAGLLRAVLASGDETMIDGFRRVGAKMTERVVGVLEEARAAGHETPSARDVGFALLLTISVAHHVIVAGTEWCGLDLERDDIYERVAIAVTAYLDAVAANEARGPKRRRASGARRRS